MELLNPKNQVPSVYKAFKILECISTNNEGSLGITEIQKQLNYPKSTIHSILSTLVLLGYAKQDKESKKYFLGIRIHELGNAYRKHLKFMEIFSSLAKNIREKCNETIYLAILDGTDIVYMGREESSEPLRMAAGVGTRLPAHVTALGKVLLAQKQDSEIKGLYSNYTFIKYTETTITDVESLVKILKEIRSQGYALDHHEKTSDVECYSAPVFNHQNEAVAAISIAVPSTRTSGEISKKFIKLITEGAKEFSLILGSLEKEIFQGEY